MEIKKQSVPTVSGFYFVKTKFSAKWQLLVQVIGLAPFLGIERINAIFNPNDDTILNNLLDLDWSEAIEMNLPEPEMHRGYVITPEAKEGIRKLLIAGSKLAAVKFLKDSTDGAMGLKDAKDYCDAYQSNLKAEFNADFN